MAIVFDSAVSPSGGIIFDSPVYVGGANFAGLAVAIQRFWHPWPAGAAQDPAGITANDIWTEPVSIKLVQDVSVGVLQLQINGLFTYTPPPTFAGIVTFQYQLYELGVASNVGTVTITVSGDFTGQVVSGNLLKYQQISSPVLGFAGNAANIELIQLHYASGFSGIVSLPFLGAAVPPSILRLAHAAGKQLGQNGIAQSTVSTTQLSPGNFVVGVSFIQSAQSIRSSQYVMSADKVMGWQGTALNIKGQPQVIQTSAPFMTQYPIIINATFTLSSWSASVSFE